jgi:nitroimidazol reductase NimA-like FMN-containing flavoprotein (pyridoxamine 5'-phosphate oxidase superfamily)
MAYEHSKMSEAQIEDFLAERRFAIVGTYENGRAYISFFKESAKYRNLDRDPRIALCIVGNYPDSRSVMIYGMVEMLPEGSPEVDDLLFRLTRRHFDSDDEARDFDDVPDESVLAIVIPSKILGEDYN